MTGPTTTVTVVLVTHDSADDLPGTLGALAPQLQAGDEVVVVDNASRDDSATVARRALPAATVIEPGVNLGFAAGCNRGVAAGHGDLVLLLNPDAVPAPGFLDALRGAAAGHPTWGAWQALVTLPGGRAVNSSGNHVHFLGFGWAGGHDDPIERAHDAPRTIGFASGAAMVVRRAAWDAAGGFQDHYFMYGEDLDLSLRLRLAGWELGVVPAARAEHDYAFVKGDYKWFHLERNRWWTIVGAYPRRLLLLLLPALVAFEIALLPAAAAGGWLRPKLRAQRAVVRDLPAMVRHRRTVQATRTISARTFADGLTPGLDSPFLAGAARIPGIAAALRGFWAVVRRCL
ncbi:MAG: glycosyltransferase family 2 protein [Solirubrobacteraceae bacterium]|nr:glycosyltransferase family 2 protein [Solirubrobacteraceae bacterium]